MLLAPETLSAQRRPRQGQLILLGLVVLLASLLLCYQIWLSHEEQLRNAGVVTRNYASILEARLDTTLRRTDTVTQALMRTTPVAALNKGAVARYAEEITAEMDSRLLNFDELAGLRIFDADGDLLYSSGSIGKLTVSIADRRYFSQVREDPLAGLVFSELLIARTTGRPSVVAARGARQPRRISWRGHRAD